MTKTEREENQKIWFSRIREMQSSGMTQKEWCQKNKIDLNSMYYWLRKYRETENLKKQPFAWLEIPRNVRTEIADLTDQDLSIKLKCAKATVILPSDIPAETAATLLKVVAEL